MYNTIGITWGQGVCLEAPHNVGNYVVNRELTQERRRRRLRERHNTMGLMSKNKSSARPARAFCMLVHFVAVLVLTIGSSRSTTTTSSKTPENNDIIG